MTDGPFKNSKLEKCWRRVVEAVQNDAPSPAECGALVSDALTRHLFNVENVKALQELCNHLGQSQLDLDPLGPVEAIFDKYEKTRFLDALRKELLCRTADSEFPQDAFALALTAVVDKEKGELRSRLQEEFICAQEAGEIGSHATERALDKIDAAFDLVDSDKVSDALLAGAKDAFKNDLNNGDGVEDGLVPL